MNPPQWAATRRGFASVAGVGASPSPTPFRTTYTPSVASPPFPIKADLIEAPGTDMGVEDWSIYVDAITPAPYQAYLFLLPAAQMATRFEIH